MINLRSLPLLLLSLAACAPDSSSARSAIGLGMAESFTVLAGSTVTNTGPSTIVGDLGVSPGLAVTGFPPGLVTGGVIHAADALALQAQQDLTTAYVTLAGQHCDHDLTGQDLGGLVLTAGVYCFASSAELTGALILDAEGNPDAVFVFQIGSTLITASNASVLVINGAQRCNAFWQVGSSATLGTTTTFVGSILALTSITLDTGAQISGRALARNGAVTMDTNHVEAGTCGVVAGPDAAVVTADGAAEVADAAVAIDAGMADASPGDGGPCVAERCGDTCVDTGTDHDNCGACGNVCGWDLECVAGSCECSATTCGDICVDLDENPHNCGACGLRCGDGEWCDAGACTAVCAGTVCDGWCTDLATNDSACGVCGHACGPAEDCLGGECICTGTMCGATCVDLSESASHCGACDNDCGAGNCCTDGECAPL